MKYFIAKKLRIDDDAVEINETDYDLVNSAYTNLSQSIFLEEKFDILLENYSEYEKELLAIAWDSLLFMNSEFEQMVKERDHITRRILNLLGTCSIYYSQWKIHLKRMSGISSNDIKGVEDFIKEQKSTLFGFKFGCMLRNYAIHYDLPVSLYSYSFSDDETNNGKVYKKSIVTPKIKVFDLIRDSKMKKISEDLESRFDDSIDLRPLIREYILGLSKINFKIRVITSEILAESERQIFDSLKLLSIITPSKRQSIYLIQKEEENKSFDYSDIYLGFIARRKYYVEKNNLFDSFLDYYATNQI